MFLHFVKTCDKAKYSNTCFGKCPLKTLGDEDCFGGISQNKKHKFSKYVGVRWCPEFRNFRICGMSRYKEPIFPKMVPCFFLYFWSIWVIKRGVKGHKKWFVRSSRNLLKSIAICPGTLISNLGTSKTPKYFWKTLKNKRKPKRSLELFCLIGALLQQLEPCWTLWISDF